MGGGCGVIASEGDAGPPPRGCVLLLDGELATLPLEELAALRELGAASGRAADDKGKEKAAGAPADKAPAGTALAVGRLPSIHHPVKPRRRNMTSG